MLPKNENILHADRLAYRPSFVWNSVHINALKNIAAIGSKPLKPSSWAVMVDVLWAAASVGSKLCGCVSLGGVIGGSNFLTLLRVGQFV